ncbi:hypothetical protein PsorP6_001550 [Peronosclerospora sorghi]|uniref:Uncharacterized protein n=1 Tax=Peronosclerospora sorghi TaxID=230839 RepID=A0ACC0WW20_9STRA|nr:hypothetical protein PsorP6_001550 [Peronosclerospora sorghi]
MNLWNTDDLGLHNTLLYVNYKCFQRHCFHVCLPALLSFDSALFPLALLFLQLCLPFLLVQLHVIHFCRLAGFSFFLFQGALHPFAALITSTFAAEALTKCCTKLSGFITRDACGDGGVLLCLLPVRTIVSWASPLPAGGVSWLKVV